MSKQGHLWLLAGICTIVTGYQAGLHSHIKAQFAEKPAERQAIPATPLNHGRDAAQTGISSHTEILSVATELARLMQACEGLGKYQTQRLLAREAGKLSAPQLREILAALTSPGFSNRPFASQFSKELASFIDPDDVESGSKILSLAESKWDRQDRFGRMCSRLTARNPQELLANLKDLAKPYSEVWPESAFEKTLIETAASLWTDRSWSQAWKFADGDDALSKEIRAGSIGSLLRINPELSIEMLQDGTLAGIPKEERSKWLSLSVLTLAQRDPLACYQAVSKSGIDLTVKEVRSRLLMGLAETQGEEFLERAKADASFCHLPVFGAAALREAIGGDPALATRMFQDMSAEERKQALNDMGALQPYEGSASALAAFMTQPGVADSISKDWLMKSWAALAAREPPTAEQALQQWQPAGGHDEARQWAVQALAKAWAADDPARALALADEQDASQKAAIYQAVAGPWAIRDGPAALAWARGIGDPELRSETLLAAISQLRDAPPGTMAALTEALAAKNADLAGLETPLFPSFVAGKAVQSDPVGAVNEVMAQPDSAARTEMVDALTTEWANQDVAGLAEWLGESSTLQGERRDAAVLALIRQIAADPGTSLHWAASIESLSQRQEALEKIVASEALAAPQAAEAARLIAAGDVDALAQFLQGNRPTK